MGLSSDIWVSAGAWAEGLWGDLGHSLAMEKVKGGQETCPGGPLCKEQHRQPGKGHRKCEVAARSRPGAGAGIGWDRAGIGCNYCSCGGGQVTLDLRRASIILPPDLQFGSGYDL